MLSKISLINKIILAVIFSVLVFGFLAIVFVYIYSKNSIIKNSTSRFQELSIEQSQETFLILTRTSALVKSIAENDNLLLLYLENHNKLQADQILQHFNLYDIRKLYSAVYLMDKDGNVLVSTDPSFVGNNYSFRNYFKESIVGKSYTDISMGVTSKQLGYYFSYPIKDKIGNILGVLVIKMDPDVINESLKSDNLSNNVMLVDVYGVIIYSNVKDRLFHSLGELSENIKKDLENQRRYEDMDITPLQYQIVADNLNINKQIVLLDYFDKFDNKDELMSIVKLGGYNFFIITEQNKDLYISQATNLALILSLFILIGVTLAAIFIYLIVRIYLKPLNDLKIMAHKLQLNEFNYRIDIKDGGDLSNIAKSFNLAAEKLEDNQINMEKIIAKRTKQLEIINKTMIGREVEMVKLKKEINKYKK